MDNERTREFCLSMPHTVECVGWGHHLVFWVGDKAIGGKMFALIHLDGEGSGVVWFHAGPERYPELLEMEGIIPAPYMAKAHWVTVERWDVFRARDFEEHLANAHNLVYEKLSRGVKILLALPQKERNKLIRERKKVLSAKEKPK
jgi:predicted DNA-binding protein (MmcQ/YjbR family)